MRHAQPADLAAITPLLERLRALPGLMERKPGTFYRGGKAFLHFHEHEGALLADLKEGKDWVRLGAGKSDWPAIVRKAKALSSAR